jgi:hypothetical protein
LADGQLIASRILRATGDIDLFVEKSDASERLLRQVLTQFGFGSTLPKGALFERNIIMLGRPPFRIDLLAEIDGVSFDEAWQSREFETFDGLTIPFLSRACLIKNKSSTGRPKDFADVVVATPLPAGMAMFL